MSTAWYSCKGCVGSDPTQDTVKVDVKLLLAENPNKENTMPQQQTVQDPKVERETAQKAKKLVEEARKQVEDELQHTEELAAAARAEDQRWAKEQLEEKARKEAESRAKRESNEKMRREQVAADEKATAAAAAATAAAAAEEVYQRHLTQMAADEAEAREQQLVAAKKKVSEWCKSNGYQDMNIQKKTFRGATKFPLHTAAKHNNEDIIAMLLMCGVDKYALDSKKQTAHEVATKLNKKGSNEMILARLR